jgi:hypothetical protein
MFHLHGEFNPISVECRTDSTHMHRPAVTQSCDVNKKIISMLSPHHFSAFMGPAYADSVFVNGSWRGVVSRLSCSIACCATEGIAT